MKKWVKPWIIDLKKADSSQILAYLESRQENEFGGADLS